MRDCPARVRRVTADRVRGVWCRRGGRYRMLQARPTSAVCALARGRPRSRTVSLHTSCSDRPRPVSAAPRPPRPRPGRNEKCHKRGSRADNFFGSNARDARDGYWFFNLPQCDCRVCTPRRGRGARASPVAPQPVSCVYTLYCTALPMYIPQAQTARCTY